MAKKKRLNLLPVIYLIFGTYFLNFGIGYFPTPEYLLKINTWIFSLGGIVFLIAFYRSIVYSNKMIRHRIIKAAK